MKLFWAVLGGACCTGHILVAEPQITYNSFGMPGLIDMPSAQSAPDAELIFSVSQSGKSLRNTLTFQISPRLTGAFRYSAIGRPTNTLYDRSFDLRYRLLDETERWPSVAVGLQDFIGTGQAYSALEMNAAYGEAVGRDLPYVIAPRRPGDVPTCLADVRKAKKVLCFETQFGPADMCQSSWNWIETQARS